MLRRGAGLALAGRATAADGALAAFGRGAGLRPFRGLDEQFGARELLVVVRVKLGKLADQARAEFGFGDLPVEIAVKRNMIGQGVCIAKGVDGPFGQRQRRDGSRADGLPFPRDAIGQFGLVDDMVVVDIHTGKEERNRSCDHAALHVGAFALCVVIALWLGTRCAGSGKQGRSQAGGRHRDAGSKMVHVWGDLQAAFVSGLNDDRSAIRRPLTYL